MSEERGSSALRSTWRRGAFACAARAGRRTPIDGIDFVEVLSNHEGTPGYIAGAPQQRTLLVHLVNGPVPTAWTADHVRIVGGVRNDPALNPVGVVWAFPAEQVLDGSAGLPLGDRTLVEQALTGTDGLPDDEARSRSLVVRTSSSGDWSTYTLRLQDPGDADGSSAPVGIDIALAAAPITFTIDCPSDLDCQPDTSIEPTPEDLLPGDYLARDYEATAHPAARPAGLAGARLDRHQPGRPGRHARRAVRRRRRPTRRLAGRRRGRGLPRHRPPAYVGAPARPAAGLPRARGLLGAHPAGVRDASREDGTGPDDLLVPASTPVTDLPFSIAAGSPLEAADAGAVVFETTEPLRVRRLRNALPLYAWSDADHCLSTGTTAAFVTTALGEDPQLTKGDLLVLVEQPAGGSPLEGDLDRRYAVRLVRDAERFEDLVAGVAVWQLVWSLADALPGPLRVREGDADDVLAVALANVVVADHGATVRDATLVPQSIPTAGSYRPRLRHPGSRTWIRSARPPQPRPTFCGPTRPVLAPRCGCGTADVSGSPSPTCSAAAGWTLTSSSSRRRAGSPGCGSVTA